MGSGGAGGGDLAMVFGDDAGATVWADGSGPGLEPFLSPGSGGGGGGGAGDTAAELPVPPSFGGSATSATDITAGVVTTVLVGSTAVCP